MRAERLKKIKDLLNSEHKTGLALERACEELLAEIEKPPPSRPLVLQIQVPMPDYEIPLNREVREITVQMGARYLRAALEERARLEGEER